MIVCNDDDGDIITITTLGDREKRKGDFCLRRRELFPGFSGFRAFSYFAQNKQLLINWDFEGGSSFNRSLVSQVKDINKKTNST